MSRVDHTSPLPHQFAAEPVIGWRVWKIDLSETEPRLSSVYHAGIWLPGVPFEAACGRFPFTGHDTPETSCDCGIYAAKDPMSTIAYIGRDRWSAIGRCQLWGELIEGETAWRASRAYPLCLSVIAPSLPKESAGYTQAQTIADRLAEAYGVEASFSSYADDLLRLLFSERAHENAA